MTARSIARTVDVWELQGDHRREPARDARGSSRGSAVRVEDQTEASRRRYGAPSGRAAPAPVLAAATADLHPRLAAVGHDDALPAARPVAIPGLARLRQSVHLGDVPPARDDARPVTRRGAGGHLQAGAPGGRLAHRPGHRGKPVRRQVPADGASCRVPRRPLSRCPVRLDRPRRPVGCVLAHDRLEHRREVRPGDRAACPAGRRGVLRERVAFHPAAGVGGVHVRPHAGRGVRVSVGGVQHGPP